MNRGVNGSECLEENRNLVLPWDVRSPINISIADHQIGLNPVTYVQAVGRYRAENPATFLSKVHPSATMFAKAKANGRRCSSLAFHVYGYMGMGARFA